MRATTLCSHTGAKFTEFINDVVLDRERAVFERGICGRCHHGGVPMPDRDRALPYMCGSCYTKNGVFLCRKAALASPSSHMLMGCARCGRSFHILAGSGYRPGLRVCWAKNTSQEDVCAPCETLMCKEQSLVRKDNLRYFSGPQKRVLFTLLLVRNRLRRGPYTIGALDRLVWNNIFLYSL
jgi:hypothetical protein